VLSKRSIGVTYAAMALGLTAGAILIHGKHLQHSISQSKPEQEERCMGGPEQS
jgi:hypothetical protein